MFHIDDVPSGAGEGIKDVTKALAVSLSPDAILTLLSWPATFLVPLWLDKRTLTMNQLSLFAADSWSSVLHLCLRQSTDFGEYGSENKDFNWRCSATFFTWSGHCFCSLLPLRHKLLCYPSKWVSVTIESEPTTNSADFDPIFPDLRDFPRDRLFFKVFYRNVA